MLTDGLQFLEGSINTNFVFPYVTKAQKDAIPMPTLGEAVLQTDNDQGLYVYNGAAWIKGINTTLTTLDATTLPVFGGDLISNGGTANLYLVNQSGLAAGSYNKVTINTKGLVTSATNETTLDGLGITDAVNVSLLPTGDATSTQIVRGNDSRLTDAREPKTHTVSKISDFGTAVDTKITNALASFVGGVSTVNGKTGVVVLSKDDIGLSAVDNTSDLTKPISTATQSALGLKESLSNKNAANGYVGLNASTKIDGIYLPAITLNNRFVTTTIADRNALSAAVGDVAIVAGTVNKTFILNALPTNVDDNWIELLNPMGGVTSINGETGVVTLTLGNIAGVLPANKLPAISGDVTSAAGTGVFNLSTTGVTAGTYNSLTVDSKGRVTAGSVQSYGTTDASNLTSGTLNVARLPAFSGDVISTAGTASLSLTDSGVTAGSYNTVTVDSKGRVVDAVNAPVYLKTEVDNLLTSKLDVAKLNKTNGYVGLNSNKKIDSDYLPAITLNNRFAVSTLVARNALSAAIGDVAIVAGSVNKTFILNAAPATLDANWLELLNPLGGVTSVNGNTGVVTISVNDLTGTLPIASLPSFAGDVISTIGTNEIHLKNISTAGTYNKLTINAKGLVTNASSETTLDGLGITDAINVSLLPVSGDASSTQIVLGNDSRLTDAREPKTHTVSKISDFGTAVDTKITNALASFAGGVSSVNTKTGVIVLNKDDIGLSAVNNTSDLSKPISTAAQAEFALKESLSNKGIANGYAGLNASTKIDGIYLPAITLNNRFAVSTLVARDALNAAVGDVAIVAGSVNKTFILNATPASVDANWLELLNPLGGVTSINGNTGVVTLTLGNITGTLPINKLPAFTGDVVSTAGSGTFELSTTGVTAGTYNSLTVDSKGRVTAASTQSYGTTDASNLTSGILGAARLPAFTGDVTSNVGTSALTLSDTGVTAGSYNTVTVDSKGRITDAQNKPIYTKTEVDTLLTSKLDISKLNKTNGYVGLNSNKKIDSNYLPAITLNSRFAVASLIERNALSASIGDVAIVAGSVNKTFILNALPATLDTNWMELLNPAGGVTSVNGNTGVVTISVNDLTGILPIASLPALSGDVISAVGTNEISLKDISTAGTYNKLTINAKGLVTAATSETTLDGLGITDAINKSLLPTGDATSTQIVLGNDSRLTDTRTPKAHTHVSSDITDLGATIDAKITTLKDSVPTDGNTLKKLYELIINGATDIVVADIAARDALDIKNAHTSVFVQDAGNSKWALFKATTTGANATYVKLSDPDTESTNNKGAINGYAGLDANKLLSPTNIPAFTGDATTTAGSTALTLIASGVAAGDYNKVTVDTKGRVTNGVAYDVQPITVFRRSKPAVSVNIPVEPRA